MSEKSSTAKLKWEQVREIRKLKKEGMLIYQLTEIYNVSRGCIDSIINNKSWKE